MYRRQGEAVNGVSRHSGVAGLSPCSVTTVTQVGTGICPRKAPPQESSFGAGQCCSPFFFLHCFAMQDQISQCIRCLFFPYAFWRVFYLDPTCVASVFFSRCLQRKGKVCKANRNCNSPAKRVSEYYPLLHCDCKL